MTRTRMMRRTCPRAVNAGACSSSASLSSRCMRRADARDVNRRLRVRRRPRVGQPARHGPSAVAADPAISRCSSRSRATTARSRPSRTSRRGGSGRVGDALDAAPASRVCAGTTVSRRRRATSSSRSMPRATRATGYPRVRRSREHRPRRAPSTTPTVHIRFVRRRSRISTRSLRAADSSRAPARGRPARATCAAPPFNLNPVGNGPFRFVARGRSALGLRAQRPISCDRWAARRGCVASWWRLSTSQRRSSPGWRVASSTSPASRRRWQSLVSRDPSLRVVDYPVLFSNGHRVQRLTPAVRRRPRAQGHCRGDRPQAHHRCGARGVRDARVRRSAT